MRKRPRHRWFQFSLTSLFVAMTLVAVWMAWELAFLRQRQAWLRDNAALADPVILSKPIVITNVLPTMTTGFGSGTARVEYTVAMAPPQPREAFIPWWRRMLGDEGVPFILEGADWTNDEWMIVAKLFPEAEILTRPEIGPLPIFAGSAGDQVWPVLQKARDDGKPIPQH